MPHDRVAFYLAAHADDWILFSGHRAWADLRGGAKVVLVHTTAGDAGRTDGFWEAREQGAIAAARAALSPAPLTVTVVQRGRHPVVRWRCANAVLLFLRLPDGNPGGTGHAATGRTSLAKLRDAGTALAAVDGSTTYTGWDDLGATLAAILEEERRGIGEAHPWIHAADGCAETNPGDHADHMATADALQAFAPGRYRRAWWQTYGTAARPPNLSGEALAGKEALFSAYAREVERAMALGGADAAPTATEWRMWGDKAYGREVEADAP